MIMIEALRSQQNVGPTERLLSIAAGAAMLAYGLSRPRTLPKNALTIAGLALTTRGVVGYSTVYRALDVDLHKIGSTVRVHKSIAIRRPVDEVFQFFAVSPNLQLAIKRLERIEKLADGFQRWYFRAPRGLRFSCDLELTRDQENTNLISWRSRRNAAVPVQGFLSARQGRDPRETELRASISFEPPLGIIGNLAARSMSPVTDRLVIEALRNVRQILEARVLH